MNPKGEQKFVISFHDREKAEKYLNVKWTTFTKKQGYSGYFRIFI